MSLSESELFSKLLEQIKLDLPDEQSQYFEQAKVKKVVVHQQSKVWQFYFEFADILPFGLFTKLGQHLQQAFADIARVKFSISSREAQVDNQKLADYWRYAVKTSGITSPFIQDLCEKGQPYLNDRRVLLLADNEIIKNFLVTQALEPIETAYQTVGFPKLAIHPMIDESASQQKIDEFKAQKAKQDAALAKQAAVSLQKAAAQKEKKSAEAVSGPILMGRQINTKEEVRRMIDLTEEENSVVIEGYVFDVEVRVLRSKRQLLIFKMTDYTSSFTVKKFSRTDEDEQLFAAMKPGIWVKVKGSIQEDNFMRDLVLNGRDIQQIKHQERLDQAPEGEKRVELHLHTNMSQMDATNNISEYVAQAAKWGQTAVAVTDHAAVQAFPEAHTAGLKNNVKILYGVEANLVDDGVPIAYNLSHAPLKDTEYVVFDTETTGLSAVYDSIIELAAVKMKNGEVIDEFEAFIDPGHPLSETTINLTSITDDMVRGTNTEQEAFTKFQAFYQGTVLVGHNVTFDIGFLNAGYARHDMGEVEVPIVDTLELARLLHPEFKNHKLDSLAKRFKVNLEHHHRANADAESTGHLLFIFLKDAEKRYNMQYIDDLNSHLGENDAYKQARPFHAVLMAKTQAGLKNLFKLVSLSMISYFYRIPRLPRSVVEKYREGIMIGSACSSGEVFTTMMQKGYNEARKKAKFYDYLEIMPKAVYAPLLERQLINNNGDLEEIIQNIVKIGAELGKPVVATGDVHYLDPVDKIYRKILINSQGGANPLNRINLPDVHFRTTDEMLKSFHFLGEATAKEVVVTNPQKIAAEVEVMSPVKNKLYTPKMPGAEDDIKTMTYTTAHELYGEKLPEIVEERISKELKSIIGNGFAVHYLIAQKLVHKSNKDGYLVGSRGSVGSSLVAYLAGITEINALPPHYRCNKCHYTKFFTKGEYGSGYDLPDQKCPDCGSDLEKDGHDIPFETFLGFHGDKVPDIDLNFSGDYQPIAHNYMKVLFGENNVYRAGTIGTVADKTGYGYVKAYERDTGQTYRGAEIDRLAKGTTGVKRTTGQHPAGILIVPDYMDIYDFTPIQYPADDQSAPWKTSHFDFHSIHDNILKMDILGHDDPTMIRKLQDLSGIEPKSIPPVDPKVMSLFSGTDALDVTPEQIGSKTGTLGIPEFGTRFVRGMLEETHPTTFSELLQISGLSHGTDVWLGNAEELIQKNVVTLKDVIGCRDNIMLDLIHYGMDASMAFQIMEHVRKGRGIPDEWQKAMRENENVPNWYIDSCLKIKYMFPKAHAAAYILMALRVAYFKVYYPILYYAAYFTVRAEDFDLVAMAHGKDAVKAAMKEITDKGMDASAKEKNLLTVLELANEMLERGFKFEMVSVERSDAAEFVIEDDGKTLLAPFRAVPSLGMNVAKQIVSAREEKPFLSKEDLSKRGKVSKTLIDYLTENHVLDGMPDENQLSLFDMM
ncbi:PolC-type DNA polymerase III [Loigolactobacillus backii]|uniref:PolC-type DNA polymerase III n=1 Tax=Loigolactobacillus backii TaxID=375175 RepID=UPI000C1C9DCD|nr:PolC-type DNA polymerase III [Loigolactobacillus backii]PIO84397.1 PolC-type DNA polymerase III [Loigolactobacillus backii]